MTGTVWGKFFWQDWESDEALRQCSLAAQGLWMRMLCICAKSEAVGYLAVAGNPLDAELLARHVGDARETIDPLLFELENWHVFSRDRRGWIYSRRMIRDTKKRDKGKINASKRWSEESETKQEKLPPNGANETQWKKATISHKPEKKEAPNGAKKEVLPNHDLDIPKQFDRRKPKTAWPEDFQPTPETREVLNAEGHDDEAIGRELARFGDDAQAHERKYANWQAAFRNRFRSRFYTDEPGPGGNAVGGTGSFSGGRRSTGGIIGAVARAARSRGT